MELAKMDEAPEQELQH